MGKLPVADLLARSQRIEKRHGVFHACLCTLLPFVPHLRLPDTILQHFLNYFRQLSV